MCLLNSFLHRHLAAIAVEDLLAVIAVAYQYKGSELKTWLDPNIYFTYGISYFELIQWLVFIKSSKCFYLKSCSAFALDLTL
jgi:hypothetical protein